MNLAASLMVANGEMGRYLPAALPALLEYVDEVRILDDATDDGFSGWVEQFGRVFVKRNETPAFFVHEGRCRQRLLDWTLEGQPDWVLSIDADEFVADGPGLRRVCEQVRVATLGLCLWEVWQATPEALRIRQDGGWAEKEAPVVWAPGRLRGPLTIADRALACGRTPEQVRSVRPVCAGSLLHFGWARLAEREARHERYAVADGGRFHSSRHLDSILWDDQRVITNRTAWPDGLHSHRERIAEIAGRP